MHVTVNDGSFIFKYVDCNKNYEKEFDENLSNRSQNT